MSARKTQSPIYSQFEFALQSDMRLAGKPWIITAVLVFVNILDGIKETHGISPLSTNPTTVLKHLQVSDCCSVSGQLNSVASIKVRTKFRDVL